MLNDEERSHVQLAMTQDVGPLLRMRLLEAFGSAERVLAAGEHQLQRVDGVGPKIARRIVYSRRDLDLDVQLQLVEQYGLQLLLPSRDDYPRNLRDVPDPPGVLFARGALVSQDQLAIGIVGTRHCTSYGRQQAQRLAGGLARAGFTIVSGLARGVDAAAHRGALDAGGRTIAVLGSGVLNIYPPEHGPLSDEIAESGCVMSEAAPRMPPSRGMFPQRNRIISGLSLGTVVIEAPERSGALITARHAYEQGREVFAVPGQISSRQSAGPHQLIRDGAKLVATVDDILEELGPLVEPAVGQDGATIRSPAELQLNEIEQLVLGQIDPAGSSIDDLPARCDAPIQRILSTISVLEVRRLVKRVSGNQVVRC